MAPLPLCPFTVPEALAWARKTIRPLEPYPSPLVTPPVQNVSRSPRTEFYWLHVTHVWPWSPEVWDALGGRFWGHVLILGPGDSSDTRGTLTDSGRGWTSLTTHCHYGKAVDCERGLGTGT